MSPKATIGAGAARTPAPQERTDARRELGQLERLDHVVVGAGVEPGDAIGDGVARGDDQHRTRVAAPAHAAQHVETFLARQPEVEQHEVVHVLGERELGRAAVAHPVDGEAVLAQSAADRLADHRVVFGEEQAHAWQRVAERIRRGAPAPLHATLTAISESRGNASGQDFGSNLSDAEFMQ